MDLHRLWFLPKVGDQLVPELDERRRVLLKMLANRLRETVRAFKPSTDPEDLQEHLRVVLAMMGDDLALPVINAAGLSVAEWYRRAPELSAKGPALRIVK